MSAIELLWVLGNNNNNEDLVKAKICKGPQCEHYGMVKSLSVGCYLLYCAGWTGLILLELFCLQLLGLLGDASWQ